ncbi:hypothetical protein HY251_00525 [bacterium]|nr:hypothetical protein [bacterium]
MADPEDADAVRRSLGLKPRSRESAEPAPEATAAVTADTETPPPATKPGGLGLGIRRRTGEGGRADFSQEPSGLDAAHKPVGRLPADAQMLLRNYYRARPDVDLPGYLHALDGTHGFTMGSDRPGREIVLGFAPAFVLFVLPLYPDGPPDAKRGGLKAQRLHAQPELTETGFKVPDHLNKLDVALFFIAWKADESTQQVAPKAAKATATKESPREARQREARERADAARRARDEKRAHKTR